MTTEELRKLPKIELHCHLDGSLSRDFFEKRLGREVRETELQVEKDCQNLAEYLAKFRLPLECLQSAESFEDAGYDILRTMSGENVRYAEIRFAPLSSVSERLSVRRMLEALLAGLERGKKEYDIAYNVIVCAMRHQSEELNYSMFQTAREFLGAGVCAADLAGAEAQYPMSEFMELFGKVKKLGMPFTIHAGECGNAENIADAVRAGAARIGHGIAMQGRRDIQKLVKKASVGMEMCPTSNLQTRTVSDMTKWPLREFLDNGLLVTINTDNRTISGTSLTEEFGLCLSGDDTKDGRSGGPAARQLYGLRDEEIMQCMKNAVQVSFADESVKDKLYRELTI